MVAVISPWNGVVFWLDPAGASNEIREYAQKIINEYVLLHFLSSKYMFVLLYFKSNIFTIQQWDQEI